MDFEWGLEIHYCAGIGQQIQDELSQRIMVMDGAMGTMIQTYKLEEEDFRGVLAYLLFMYKYYVLSCTCTYRSGVKASSKAT